MAVKTLLKEGQRIQVQTWKKFKTIGTWLESEIIGTVTTERYLDENYQPKDILVLKFRSLDDKERFLTIDIVE